MPPEPTKAPVVFYESFEYFYYIGASKVSGRIYQIHKDRIHAEEQLNGVKIKKNYTDKELREKLS